MSNRKVYTHGNLDDFIVECGKFINSIIKKHNKDKNIILPTEQEYKDYLQNILENVSGVSRCSAIYSSGINRGKRCQATPQENSKFCRNHYKPIKQPDETDHETLEKFAKIASKTNQDPESLEEAIELKEKLNDPKYKFILELLENKQLSETDPKFLEALELLKKTKLNQDE
jgi:hypothetical protein